MLERDIEKAVCAYAKEKGFLHYKFSSPAHIGVPDRIFVGDNTVFFIEFKSEKGKLTPSQIRENTHLAEKNALVFVVYGVDEGKAIIDAAAKHIDRMAAIEKVGEMLRMSFEMDQSLGQARH